MSLTNRPKAIIFDWDETLVSSQDILRRAWVDTIEHFLPDQASSIPHNRAGRSGKEVFPEIFGDIWEEALSYYRTLYVKYRQRGVIAKENALSLVEYLYEQKFYLAIASNKAANFLRDEVALIGWEKYFNNIVGSTDCPYDKPAADPALKALEFSDIQPEETWFIGDSIVDMQCALSAGCIPILYLADEEIKHSEAYRLAHFHLDDHADLIDIIKKL